MFHGFENPNFLFWGKPAIPLPGPAVFLLLPPPPPKGGEYENEKPEIWIWGAVLNYKTQLDAWVEETPEEWVGGEPFCVTSSPAVGLVCV